MLYFEDFMEVIEHMPEELRDQLRSIRDLDQGAHAAMNPLSAKINTFFQNCKYSNMSESEKKVEYEKILHEFDKALDYSKEKIAIAEKIFVSYLKAVKKLDSDLTKFRLELEADDSGLTGKVEHRIDTLFGRNGSRIDKRRARLRAGHLFSANRSLQRRRMPFPHDHQDKQYYVVKRRFSVMDTPMNMSSQSPYAGGNGASTTLASQSAMGSFDSDPVSQVLAPDGEMRNISSMGSAGSLDLNGPEHEYSSFNADSPVYGDDDDEDDLQLKFGSGRRRALGNTRLLSHQRHQHQGSYSPYTANADVDGDPSMMADGLMAYPNASPSLTKSGTGESPRWIIGGEKSRRLFTPSARRPGGSSAVFDVAPSSLAGVVEPPADGGGYSTPQRYASHQSSAAATAVASRPSSSTLLQQQEAQASGGDVDDRRYCLCKDVSYGEMIACDAPSCPIEWFHYPCVNLTVAPKGKWICPLCSGTTATNTTGSLVGAGTSSPRYIGSSSSSATPSAVPSTRKRLNRR